MYIVHILLRILQWLQVNTCSAIAKAKRTFVLHKITESSLPSAVMGEEASDSGCRYSSYSCTSSSSLTSIDSSNIGFKLLKKHGWKEGTGLGVSEQGRLEPVETYMKKNKRGLGADKAKKVTSHLAKTPDVSDENDKVQLSSKKAKAVSKRIRKMQELEKKIQEKEFERAFFREFWPENV